ncbi:MAG TPA: PhoX family phosphatase [Blastocatellia bacterium]|nr:PhoX family phosphatase [Blastocatellia bacterium]
MQTNPTNQQESFEEVLAKRLARRDFIKGAAAAASILVINEAVGQSTVAQAQTTTGPRPLTFNPIELSTEDRIIVPAGYLVTVLARWGDPLFPDAPGFNINSQSAAAQERQFGYNPDYITFMEFPRNPLDTAIPRIERGLLWVNHEYTNPELMFPGYNANNPTREQVDIELAAHGGTVVQIERRSRRFPFGGQRWAINVNSPFNRRITAETLMEITGPAAGHALLKTTDDPTGTLVRGSLNNCAGGVTPWNTVITAEENFNQYFANLGMLPTSDSRRAQHTRYGLPTGASERKWERFYNRFDISKEPNEPFRFGYAVEIDLFNPNTPPKKRSALGRLKHEAATFAVAPDQRVACYTGDDERFDYMYKFVTKDKFNPSLGAANGDLLDEGTLYAAKFNDDGTGVWIPLIAGQGPLANWTQAEICINTRLAADLVGPTRMDRPEDIEPNPVNGKVYCVFTNNTQRGTSGRPATDKANPRVNNLHGHIIELTEKNNDPTSTEFTWEIFMLCGNPKVAADGTFFAGFDPSRVSPISSPDNIMFDQQGNMWISTDGQIGTFRMNDGIYVVPTEGPERGFLRQLLSGVPGGELAGPALGLNDRFLFASIQHPAEGSTLANPVSRFPDGGIPRPAVLVVENAGGTRVIGA